MKYCANCGASVPDNATRCPACGSAVGTAQSRAQGGFAERVQGFNETPDTTAQFDPRDIENNKVMAILSYFGLLVLVPLLAAPNSRFARFHANQGLVLCICAIAYAIAQGILGAILSAIFPWSLTYGLLGGRGPIYGILTTILGLVWLVFTVFAVIGIINASQGKAKQLPFIGKITILK